MFCWIIYEVTFFFLQNYFGCFFSLPIVISSMRWGVSAGRKTMVRFHLYIFRKNVSILGHVLNCMKTTEKKWRNTLLFSFNSHFIPIIVSALCKLLKDLSLEFQVATAMLLLILSGPVKASTYLVSIVKFPCCKLSILVFYLVLVDDSVCQDLLVWIS